MLNKELLLASNKLDSKNYTHIVTVGQRRLYMEYGYSDPDGYGSIDNDSLRISDVSYTIRMIFQDNEGGLGATLEVNGYLDPATMLYLGRSDTKVNLGTPYVITGKGGTARWDATIFNIEDVGKEIPIWLSTAPPHTNSKKTSMEESVDAQQGINDDGRSKGRDSDCRHYTDERPLCRGILYTRQFPVDRYTRHLQIPKQHCSLRNGKPKARCNRIDEHVQKEYRYLCCSSSRKRCTNKSYFKLKLTSQEALYA